ncbi:hypothetical protein NQ315_003686 [Exocentrus adspersus]|uniref:Helix-turn-helix domain-containing protein n=1 Tax=Exocentrus adspersus TaxID=1586481 RepID=A0AAV8V9Y2_9CUCU|nr:hypothetical protein NQ315_003686 [Exocentrus adspersus]
MAPDEEVTSMTGGAAEEGWFSYEYSDIRFEGSISKPTIKFTLELEENNKLPFLDVMISKNTEINSNFQTNVYRKKTNTNRYLNFDSNHHLSIKKGVIKSLYDRAKLVSSNVVYSQTMSFQLNHK